MAEPYERHLLTALEKRHPQFTRTTELMKKAIGIDIPRSKRKNVRRWRDNPLPIPTNIKQQIEKDIKKIEDFYREDNHAYSVANKLLGKYQDINFYTLAGLVKKHTNTIKSTSSIREWVGAKGKKTALLGLSEKLVNQNKVDTTIKKIEQEMKKQSHAYNLAVELKKQVPTLNTREAAKRIKEHTKNEFSQTQIATWFAGTHAPHGIHIIKDEEKIQKDIEPIIKQLKQDNHLYQLVKELAKKHPALNVGIVVRDHLKTDKSEITMNGWAKGGRYEAAADQAKDQEKIDKDIQGIEEDLKKRLYKYELRKRVHDQYTMTARVKDGVLREYGKNLSSPQTLDNWVKKECDPNEIKGIEIDEQALEQDLAEIKKGYGKRLGKTPQKMVVKDLDDEHVNYVHALAKKVKAKWSDANRLSVIVKSQTKTKIRQAMIYKWMRGDYEREIEKVDQKKLEKDFKEIETKLEHIHFVVKLAQRMRKKYPKMGSGPITTAIKEKIKTEIKYTTLTGWVDGTLPNEYSKHFELDDKVEEAGKKIDKFLTEKNTLFKVLKTLQQQNPGMGGTVLAKHALDSTGIKASENTVSQWTRIDTSQFHEESAIDQEKLDQAVEKATKAIARENLPSGLVKTDKRQHKITYKEKDYYLTDAEHEAFKSKGENTGEVVKDTGLDFDVVSHRLGKLREIFNDQDFKTDLTTITYKGIQHQLTQDQLAIFNTPGEIPEIIKALGWDSAKVNRMLSHLRKKLSDMTYRRVRGLSPVDQLVLETLKEVQKLKIRKPKPPKKGKRKKKKTKTKTPPSVKRLFAILNALLAKVDDPNKLIDVLNTEVEMLGAKLPLGQARAMLYTRYGYAVHDELTAAGSANEAIIELLKENGKKPKIHLDLGTGVGELPKRVYQEFKPSKIIATDLDPYMLVYAKKNLKGKKARVVQAMAPNIPINMIEQSDLVTGSFLMHYLSPKQTDELFNRFKEHSPDNAVFAFTLPGQHSEKAEEIVNKLSEFSKVQYYRLKNNHVIFAEKTGISTDPLTFKFGRDSVKQGTARTKEWTGKTTTLTMVSSGGTKRARTMLPVEADIRNIKVEGLASKRGQAKSKISLTQSNGDVAETRVPMPATQAYNHIEKLLQSQSITHAEHLPIIQLPKQVFGLGIPAQELLKLTRLPKKFWQEPEVTDLLTGRTYLEKKTKTVLFLRPDFKKELLCPGTHTPDGLHKMRFIHGLKSEFTSTFKVLKRIARLKGY